MLRCHSLLVGLGLLVTAVPADAAAVDPQPPNFLFIFADDQAYNTIHALGNDEIQTPHLDRLVQQGTTFTRCYNQGSWSGAVCVASRNMLNTGRFLWHAHSVSGKVEQERVAGRFWSEHLKGAGYETYFSGKWHVRADAQKAFDHARHIRPGMPNQTGPGYNRPIEGKMDAWSPWDTSFGGFWKGGKHWSEVLGDDAVDYLAQAGQRDKPFFMYLAFNAPHDPRQSPQEYVERYPLDNVAVPASYLPAYPFKDAMGCSERLRDERLAPFPRTKYAVKVNRQEYYAIITHMDAQIGRILDALQRSGKANNTYVFFSADHGLAVGNHGLMGKQNLFDHSVRVPFIVRGPDVAADRKLPGPIYLQDVTATTLELAGVAKPAHVEFRSILPILKGERDRNYDAIYGAYLSVQRMVTADRHKLVLYPKIGKALLFDLDDDPHEMKDLAASAEHEATVKRLFARLLKLQQETGDTLDLKTAYPNLL